MMLNKSHVHIVKNNFRFDYYQYLKTAWEKALEPRSNLAPTVISLFSGGGGSSIGYHMAGFKELLAVDFNKNAISTLKLNFPSVNIYHGDIAKLSIDEIFEITKLKNGEKAIGEHIKVNILKIEI